MALTFEQKYQAIVAKDSEYEGLFITAVKTTGIFCRPVCNARKPKRENVEFFENIHEAMQQGYRPCKVCRPMEHVGEIPARISQIMRSLENDPRLKLKDEDLRANGLEPNSVRRWFKRNYGMTFQSYQRMLRLNTAKECILAGNSVTHTAFDNGFESLSGFNEGFQKVFGQAPSEANQAISISLSRITTPLGPMFACATKEGICLLEFSDQPQMSLKLRQLQVKWNAVILPGSNQHLETLEQELSDYFKGTLQEFSVPVCPAGTAFQKQVWRQLQTIPYAQTRSYGKQDAAIQNPKAVRAVAAANGQNPIAIVIPCHRVIGADGSLTGYAGGLHRKKWLLDHESQSLRN